MTLIELYVADEFQLLTAEDFVKRLVYWAQWKKSVPYFISHVISHFSGSRNLSFISLPSRSLRLFYELTSMCPVLVKNLNM